MADTLSVSARVTLSWTYTEDGGQSYGSTSNSSSYTYSKTLAEGTAIDQADKLYLATGTIAGGATLTLDLAGVLTNVFGAVITFARVKAFYFELTTDTTSTGVAIGGAAMNTFVGWFKDATDKETVKNGGVVFRMTPTATAWPVTAGTADQLIIVNEDGSNVATYKLAIVGASA